MFRSGCNGGVQARERGASSGSGCQPCGERVPVRRGQPIRFATETGLKCAKAALRAGSARSWLTLQLLNCSWWAKGDLNPHVPKDTGT